MSQHSECERGEHNAHVSEKNMKQMHVKERYREQHDKRNYRGDDDAIAQKKPDGNNDFSDVKGKQRRIVGSGAVSQECR